MRESGDRPVAEREIAIPVARGASAPLQFRGELHRRSSAINSGGVGVTANTFPHDDGFVVKSRLKGARQSRGIGCRLSRFLDVRRSSVFMFSWTIGQRPCAVVRERDSWPR